MSISAWKPKTYGAASQAAASPVVAVAAAATEAPAAPAQSNASAAPSVELTIHKAKPAAPRPRPAPTAARERDKPAPKTGATTRPDGAAPATGVVQLAISPWGRVEVNGSSAGITPPMAKLTLPAGEHVVTVRNEDFPPYTARVKVTPNEPVTVRHRFGS
jgi:serine/threonine-protein kinase